MRISLLAAVSCSALLGLAAAPAMAQSADVSADVSADAGAVASDAAATAGAEAISDAELTRFADAMEAVRPIAEAAGSAPSAEQQAQMAAAIEAAGLSLERFNAISTTVSSDAVVRARAALAGTEASPAGSAAAGVTDAEVEAFSTAMAAVRPIAEAAGSSPTAEQQAQMAAAISGAGLELERFNAISSAVSADAHLRARLAVADARRGG